MPAMRLRLLVLGSAFVATVAFYASATIAQQPGQKPASDLPAAETTQKPVELRRFKAHTDWVWSVALTPDGKTLVSSGGGKDHMARSWELATGQKLQEIDVRGSAQSVIVFPDAIRSAVASADKTIALWDLKSGKELRRLRGHNDQVFTLALTRDGKTLASASADGTVRLWDVEEGTTRHTIQVSEREVMGLAFSPDNRWLLTGDYDGVAKLYSTSSGRVMMRYIGHTRAIRCAAFSQDGSRVVTAGDDKSARLWDTRSGQELINFDGITEIVYGIAVSPDGRLLAAGLADKKILIWDLAAGTLLHTFDLRTGDCLGLTFSAGSRQLVRRHGRRLDLDRQPSPQA